MEIWEIVGMYVTQMLLANACTSFWGRTTTDFFRGKNHNF